MTKHVTVYDRSGIRAVHRTAEDVRVRPGDILVITDEDQAVTKYAKGEWTSVSEHMGNPSAKT